MKLTVFGMRRPKTTTKVMLLVALVSCGVFASSKIPVHNNTPRVYVSLSYRGHVRKADERVFRPPV